MKTSICFFDLETTGLNQTKDRIIEMYILKINPDSTEEEFYSRFNPVGVPITEEATKVHGISLEDLVNEPEFRDRAGEILDFIEGSDLGGYNILSFDLPILFEEFNRANLIFNYRKHQIFDSYRMWQHFEPRTLTGASKRFLKEDLQGAHRAKNDVVATAKIFFQQLKEWNIEDLEDISKSTSDLDRRIDLTGKFVKTESGEVVISFGKHANKTIQQVAKEDLEYFRWMFEKAEMPSDTKIIARKIYAKFGS